MRHSKIKNPGIIFELLLRKLTSDTVNGIDNSPSLSIIKEFFNKKTYLGKEHELYQVLLRNKFSTETKASSLLEQVLLSRKTLNEKELKKEKYEIVKKIKETYDLDKFFETKLDKYKLYASVYKLFEQNQQDSPEQIVREKYTIIESITFNKDSEKKAETMLESYEKENKDVRLIAYKILVDKFNKKYSTQLNESQRKLIKEYIYNAANSAKLLEYIKQQVPSVKTELQKYLNEVNDKVTQIKLHETISMLDKFTNLKFVNDDNVLALLRYYELLKECKGIKHE